MAHPYRSRLPVALTLAILVSLLSLKCEAQDLFGWHAKFDVHDAAHAILELKFYFNNQEFYIFPLGDDFRLLKSSDTYSAGETVQDFDSKYPNREGSKVDSVEIIGSCGEVPRAGATQVSCGYLELGGFVLDLKQYDYPAPTSQRLVSNLQFGLDMTGRDGSEYNADKPGNTVVRRLYPTLGTAPGDGYYYSHGGSAKLPKP